MKLLFTFIFSLYILSTSALPGDEIKISPNAKSSSIVVKYTSTHKKTRAATVSIVNVKGETVNSFKTAINKGENIIPVNDIHSLKEGIYSINILVKKKTVSTKLVIFEEFL